MKNLKDKMYNYEVSPPSESWQIIAGALDEVNKNHLQPVKKSNKIFYFKFSCGCGYNNNF